jgi:hypothetical protein
MIAQNVADGTGLTTDARAVLPKWCYANDLHHPNVHKEMFGGTVAMM